MEANRQRLATLQATGELLTNWDQVPDYQAGRIVQSVAAGVATSYGTGVAAGRVISVLRNAPGEPVVFTEVPRPGAPGRFLTLRPGPFAQESIPAPGPGQTITPAMHAQINHIGSERGCHTCGTKSPGTPLGNFVADHQPPTAMTLPGQSQRLYPQCQKCSVRQGGEVRSWQQ